MDSMVEGEDIDTRVKEISDNVAADRDTVSRVLGPGLIQGIILQYLSNVFCLKEVQGCVSLYAVGLLKQEDLKEHLTRHSRESPFICDSRCRESSDVEDMISCFREGEPTDADDDMILKKQPGTVEEFQQLFSCLEYVPLRVYQAVRSGLVAMERIKRLCTDGENLDDDTRRQLFLRIESEYKRYSYAYSPRLVYGACMAGSDLKDIRHIYFASRGIYSENIVENAMLQAAARYGHVYIAKFLFESGLLDAKDMIDECCEAIEGASFYGNLGIIKYLHETVGIDFDDVATQGHEAFFHACSCGHLDVVKYLYEVVGGIDMNEINEEDRTVFMIACHNGDLDMVQYLFDTGDVDVNYRYGPSGSTALAEACISGSIDVVKYLCGTVGADTSIRGGFRLTTPLMDACCWGHLDVVKYLCEEQIDRCDLLQRNRDEDTLLMQACGGGSLAVTKYLCETGLFSMNETNRFRQTACMLACRKNQVEIVKYLYETVGNVDLNQVDDFADTAFLQACSSGSLETVKYLYEIEKVDLNGRKPNGWTVFRVACAGGFLDIVKYLYETNTVDINARDTWCCNGFTLFMHLCYAKSQHHHLEIIEYLCQTGDVDVNATNNDGETALMLACRAGHLATVEYLLRTMSRKAKLAATTQDRQTALMMACENGHFKIVECLAFSRQVNIHATNADGKTAVVLAVAKGHTQIVDFLVAVFGEEILRHPDLDDYVYSNTSTQDDEEDVSIIDDDASSFDEELSIYW